MTIASTFVPSSIISGPASGADQVLLNVVEPQAARATALTATMAVMNVVRDITFLLGRVGPGIAPISIGL